MIEIYINGEVADWNADTDAQQLALVKELSAEDEMTATAAEYSYELTLPATATNNRILGWRTSPSVANKFDGVWACEVASGGVTVFEGRLMISEIEGTNYICHLYKPARKALLDVLGDLPLKSAAPHPHKISRIEDIRRINGVYCGETEITDPTDPADDHIMFPYMSRNLPWNRPGFTPDIRLQAVGEDTLVNDENAYPAFNCLSVLRDVFAAYGFSVAGGIYRDPLFSHLYMTGDSSAWNTTRPLPCYLELGGSYQNWTSASVVATADENLGMLIGYEPNILGSGAGTTITPYNDSNQMMDGAGYINVPRTGWYRVRMQGGLGLHDTKNAFQRNQARGMYFPSAAVDDDPCDLAHNPIEVKLLRKTDGNRGYRSSIYSAPRKGSETKVNPNGYAAWTLDKGGDAPGHEGDNRWHQYPINGGAMTLAADTDRSIICGARLGGYRGLDAEDRRADDLRGNRRYADANILNMKNPATVARADFELYTSDIESRGIDTWDIRWRMSPWLYGDDTWRDGHDLGAAQAHAFIGAGALHNRQGHLELNAVTAASATTFFTEVPEPRAYNDLLYSNAHTTGAYGGEFLVDCCVYLEKGDRLSLTLCSPYCDTGKKDGDHYVRGCVGAFLRDFRMWMGYVSDEPEYWRPAPDYDFSVNTDSRLSNTNAFLPDMTCADFLSAFCSTFNLAVSATEGGYRIDRLAGDRLDGAVIDLDAIAHPASAKFERIDLPSRRVFRFAKNDAEASALALEPRWGEAVYTNPAALSGDEAVLDSKFSYCAWHNITFEGLGERRVPLICDGRWTKDGYDYDTALKDGDWTADKAPRFMFIPPTAEMVHWTWLPLLLPEDTAAGLRVDYGDLAPELFDVDYRRGHLVKVDCRLPQASYAEACPATLARFDGALYRIVKIDGFDPSGENPCEVTLRTL